MESIYHIYDKIFKKILTLSSTAVTGLINGLFDTDHPPDSTITYNWTEFHSENLRRILADTIITINGIYSYHMEAQITENDEIIFRVFDYSYHHARLHATNDCVGCQLTFPEPKIIYLCSTGHSPDVYTLHLNFGSQGSFTYRVTTFKFLETSLDDLNRKKMVILIPFQLLRLRDKLSKKRSKENLEELKSLIQNDIIGSIEENLALGNITQEDAIRLRRLTHRLYNHIYSHYEEMEDINMLTDQSLMLDIDYIEERHEKELKEKDDIISQKDAEILEKISEIASLKAQLAALQTDKF